MTPHSARALSCLNLLSRTAEDDAAEWEWPDEEWILGGVEGGQACCSHADIDDATRMRIQCFGTPKSDSNNDS